MAFREDIYRFENSIEYEYGFLGKAGKKGERRAPHRKRTPEEMRRANEWNRKKRVRRKMELNFSEYEAHFATLTYRKEDRPKDMDRLEKDVKNFIISMRRKYRKAGIEFKWMQRLEIGKRGAIHIHIIINDIPDTDMGKMVAQHWKHGRPKVEVVDNLTSGKLADYLTKAPDGQIEGQLTFLTKEEKKAFVRYSCSRNLQEPIPERKDCRRRTIENMIRDGIQPTPGYYIDQDSVRYGINPFTGFSYLHYKEIRLRRGEIGEIIPFPEEQVEEPPEGTDGKSHCAIKPLYRVVISASKAEARLLWLGDRHDLLRRCG